MTRPKILAIVPARGGSKGIPRKNVLPVAGKPLIAWTLDACREASSVDRTVVTTDDAEIARISREHGAEVVQRPPELATDTALVDPALVHVIEHLRESDGYVPDYIAYLQCTSPLTVAADIDGAVAKALETDADVVVPVCEFYYFLWRPGDSATGINHDHRVRPRRQDMDPQFIENGSVYILRTSGFLEAKHRFFGKIALFEMPLERFQEIDEPDDMKRADLLLRARVRREQGSAFPATVKAIAFDFDGVFTDNMVYLDQNGVESVRCSRAEGYGLDACREAGMKLVVLSSEVNPVVKARTEKLRLETFHGLTDKVSSFRSWLEREGLDASETVFVGNDVNDLDCLKLAGCAVVPADAHPAAMAVADIVLDAKGGQGAVRELCDRLVEHLEGRA